MHFRLHLLFQPRAHMTAQMHVHISDAPLTAATTTTAQSITTTVNVTTPQKQLRWATSSANFTGIIRESEM